MITANEVHLVGAWWARGTKDAMRLQLRRSLRPPAASYVILLVPHLVGDGHLEKSVPIAGDAVLIGSS